MPTDVRNDDLLLDRFMPQYEIREHHRILVAAPAEVTYAAARALDLQRSRAIRGIFRARQLIMGASPTAGPTSPTFLEQALSLGWRVLAEWPGREIVVGAATQPWRADVVFRGIPPDEFADFAEPGYMKIAWTLSAAPRGPGKSEFSTETRVMPTDPESLARFRRYWTFASPGILLIRRETLRLVKREAEAMASSARPAPAGRS